MTLNDVLVEIDRRAKSYEDDVAFIRKRSPDNIGLYLGTADGLTQAANLLRVYIKETSPEELCDDPRPHTESSVSSLAEP